MVAQSIMQYFEHDVVTTIRVISQDETVFPQVSICNVNPYITDQANQYLRDNLSLYSLYIPNDPNFNVSLKQSFAYDLQHILFSCSFRFKDCDQSFFEWYYHPNYGNCYNFNSDPSNVLTVAREGDGLQVELFIGPGDIYRKYIYEDKYTGAVIVIDNQETFPLKKEGLVIAAGNYVKIKVTKTETHTMPRPYSGCIEVDKIDTLLSREMQLLGLKYNRRNCIILCQQKMTIETFGCYDLLFPPIFNAKPCVTAEQFKNLTDYTLNFSNCFDLCPYECDSVSYDTSLSYTRYPSQFYFSRVPKSVRKFLAKVYNLTSVDNVTYDMFASSYLSIYIYFDKIETTVISESPSMTSVNLVAEIGGTLGLFIGVSVLSFVEVIELTIEMLLVSFQTTFKARLNKYSEKKKTKKDDDIHL